MQKHQMKNTRKSKDRFTIFEDTTNPKLIDEIVAKWKEDELDPFEWGNTYHNITQK